MMKREKEKIPLLLTWIQGAIGKQFVIKHYRYGVVKTKFLDMTKIIASAHQRKCRDMFREAVTYAMTVMADPVKKAEWLKRVRKKHRVFNQIIKFFMLEDKRLKEQRQRVGARIIRKSFAANAKEMMTGSAASWGSLPKEVASAVIKGELQVVRRE